MTTQDKVSLFTQLKHSNPFTAKLLADTLDACHAQKENYREYMTTSPVDCDTELLRLPYADYDLCCALLTMLLREDHFSNGSFSKRHKSGQVLPIIDRIIELLTREAAHICGFSENALAALNGFYVYALIDPRNNKAFYIGKGTRNRVFSHEVENEKDPLSEKKKLRTIHEIETAGLSVKRLIINWGLSENEAFAAEASLINLLNYTDHNQLTNAVSGHHVHESMTAEDYERTYGAPLLRKEDIRHSILIIKINKLYRKNMSADELYDTVRAFWAASLKSIKARKVRYVFGVYNNLIVAVYQPDEWHYLHEMIDIPQKALLKPEDYERMKNRVYFICKNHRELDEEGRFYLHKSIANLKVNQTAQNPITYLSPDTL